MLYKDLNKATDLLKTAKHLFRSHLPSISLEDKCSCPVCKKPEEIIQEEPQAFETPYPESKPAPKNQEKKYLFTHKVLDIIQRKYSLSDNVIIGISSDIRAIIKQQNVIEPNYREHRTKQNGSLSSLFEPIDLCGSSGIICNDVNMLIEEMRTARSLEPSDTDLIKIGIDQGA